MRNRSNKYIFSLFPPREFAIVVEILIVVNTNFIFVQRRLATDACSVFLVVGRWQKVPHDLGPNKKIYSTSVRWNFAILHVDTVNLRHLLVQNREGLHNLRIRVNIVGRVGLC